MGWEQSGGISVSTDEEVHQNMCKIDEWVCMVAFI